MSRRTRAALVVAAVLTALATSAGPALAAVSFTQVQQDFMCTVCHESLPVARSPEAYAENGQIRLLIKQGDNTAQIKRAMVSQFGEGVLAKPPAHGFGLLVYIIPPAVILIGLGIVAYTIPQWRRRTRAQAAAPAPDGPAPPSIEDQQRLDADLARNL